MAVPPCIFSFFFIHCKEKRRKKKEKSKYFGEKLRATQKYTANIHA